MSYLVLLCWRVNRERVSVEREKQMRPISLEEKHENFIAVVRKLEMPAATQVKMSGSEMKANIKLVTMKFQDMVLRTRGLKKSTKKYAALAKLLLLLLFC